MKDIFLSVGYVLALTEVVKRFLKPDSRFIPLVSVGFGVLISLLNPINNLTSNILYGVLLGLSASGLWDNGKAVVK